MQVTEHIQAFRVEPVEYHSLDCYIERFSIRVPDFLDAKSAVKMWNTRIRSGENVLNKG